ncbi:MAG: AMP-binding protein [Desulfovibrio sp.]
MYLNNGRTLKDVFDNSVRNYADNPALRWVKGGGYTYAELGDKVYEIQQLLKDQGIVQGDRVAILSENMPNWGVAYFAITTMGAIAVPILTEFNPTAIHHILRHAECKSLFVSNRLAPKLEDGSFECVTSRFCLDDFTLEETDEEFELLKQEQEKKKEEGHVKALREAFKVTFKEFEKIKGRFGKEKDTADKPAELSSPTDAKDDIHIIDDASEGVEPATETRKDQLLRSFKAFLEEKDSGKEHPKADMFVSAFKSGLKEFEKMKDAAFPVAEEEEVKKTTIEVDDIAVIIYTSGTTGNSKGVMLTHGNIVSNARTTRDLGEVTEQDRLVSMLPLPHTYECTLGMVIPIMGGASVHYLEKPPTPKILLPALAKIRPTFMMAVPLIIEKIYKNKILPNFNKSPLIRILYKLAPVRKKLNLIAGKKLMDTFGGELRSMCIGGAPLAPEVEQFLKEARFPYNIGYGLTETSPLSAGTMPKDTVLRATGPAIDGVEIKIINPHPQTGEGEILIKGPNVMKGYYKAPNITKEVFTEDGFFKTGDLGVFDSSGYLYIKGRLKNMILGPSGENIYPEEIEAVMYEHDFVMESLVFQQNGRLVARVHLNYEKLDEEFGSSKMTESELREKVNELLKELKSFTNERVSSFCKVTKIIEQVEPFEKTPTMKIKRYLYVEDK